MHVRKKEGGTTGDESPATDESPHATHLPLPCAEFPERSLLSRRSRAGGATGEMAGVRAAAAEPGSPRDESATAKAY